MHEIVAHSEKRDTLSWRQAFRCRKFVVHFTLSVIALLLLAIFIGGFFTYVQSVVGITPNDPILRAINARDVSMIIFTLIYCGIVIGTIPMLSRPFLLLKAAEAYVFLTLLRIFTLLMFPLEPDRAIIPLEDPIVDLFFYEKTVITKDLFFSGHVSVLVMLGFVATKISIKYILFAIAFVVAVLLLVQHAHYTIDVIAAPIFAWIASDIAHRIVSNPDGSELSLPG
jgi:PAP2 superfamily C-terminal